MVGLGRWSTSRCKISDIRRRVWTAGLQDSQLGCGLKPNYIRECLRPLSSSPTRSAGSQRLALISRLGSTDACRQAFPLNAWQRCYVGAQHKIVWLHWGDPDSCRDQIRSVDPRCLWLPRMFRCLQNWTWLVRVESRRKLVQDKLPLRPPTGARLVAHACPDSLPWPCATPHGDTTQAASPLRTGVLRR